MLVLSRKNNESIIINGNIEVIVLSTDGDTVKLGIQAPREISILRKELYEDIQNSNVEAVQVSSALKQLSQLVKSDKKDGS
jgi:carbon storage regulator